MLGSPLASDHKHGSPIPSRPGLASLSLIPRSQAQAPANSRKIEHCWVSVAVKVVVTEHLGGGISKCSR